MIDRRGTVVIMFAIVGPALLGFAGLAVDVAYWEYSQLAVQGAADAAALSAAVSAEAGDPNARIQQEATSIAASMGQAHGGRAVTVTVNNPPQAGYYKGYSSALEIIVTQQQPRFFSGLFAVTAPTVTGRAVAVAACRSDPGGDDTGGTSRTNFVLKNNETVTLGNMNGSTITVSGKGKLVLSQNANGATVTLDSPCVQLATIGKNYNHGTFVANYVSPGMNYVSIGQNCNGCSFSGGSVGPGGVFSIGQNANNSSFTFHMCGFCVANGSAGLPVE